jgi:hypothetical protein
MRAGPVYDNTMRLLATRAARALCQALGVRTDITPERLSEALAAATMYVDLLVRVGPGRLVHAEFVRDTRDLTCTRMLEYRGRIMNCHPGHSLTQFVIVLADGRVPDHFEDPPQLSVHITVVYLRERDPADFLTDPALAPLAVLGRVVAPTTRADLLRSALTLIATVPDEHDRRELVQMCAVLAAIHLDPATIDTLTKEAGMRIFLEDTAAGRDIEARAEARAEARILAQVLASRFGDDPRNLGLASALARCFSERAVDAIVKAPSRDDLVNLTELVDLNGPNQIPPLD